MTGRSRHFGMAGSFLGILSVALVALVPGVHASGVAGNAQASTTCPKANSQQGVIRFSDWQFPDTLNGDQSTLLVTTEITHTTFTPGFGALWGYNNIAQLIMPMLTQIPSVRNGGVTGGGKTIVLHFRPGLRWSNGSEITSTDLAFGFKVDSDRLSGPDCSGSCDVISRIDTPNKDTAILHLKHVYAAAIPNAVPEIWPSKWPGAWNNNPHVAASKIFQDSSFNFEGPNFPTNGPYQVSQFVRNDRIVLRPMRYYRIESCGAYLKQLIFSYYSSKAGLIAAAASGDTDVTGGAAYTVADLPELKKHTGTYTLYEGPSFTFEHLEFNVDSTYHGKPNPLASADVRDALALSLDKYGLIRSALGVDLSMAKRIAAWTPWVNTPGLVQSYAVRNLKNQYDPVTKKFVVPGTSAALADARKLLARTPFKNGFGLDLWTTSGNPTRQAQEGVIAANWSKIGVRVSPNYGPASKLFADWNGAGIFDHGQFQVAMFGFTGGPDPDGLKFNLQSKYCDRTASVHSEINGNYSCIHDSIIDRGFTVAASSFNQSVRAAAYARVQLEMNKKSYWIGLYFRPDIATADKRVVNFSMNPTTAPEWNVWNWKQKGS